MSRNELIGVLCLIGGVALFSTVEIAGKVIGARVDPVVLTFIRFSLTGVMLLAISVPALRRRSERLRGRDYLIFALNGFIGVAVAISLFHFAILTFHKAASSAVVFSANPVFVLILARFINREIWCLRKWGAVLLGTAGVCCFVWESGAPDVNSFVGLGLMLLSAFFFALSICIAKRMIPRYGAMVLMGFSALFGSIMLLPVALLRLEGIEGLVEASVPVLYVALFGTALAYALYYYGLTHISANKGAMTFFLKPVLASFLAVLLLGEEINAWMLGGTALILAGLVLMVLNPGRFLQAVARTASACAARLVSKDEGTPDSGKTGLPFTE